MSEHSADYGLHVHTCQHGQPEGECAACAACLACSGECGSCPYSIVLTAPELREVWGIQQPPSVWVERDIPVRELAERALIYTPGGVLVRRYVTEWEPVTPRPVASAEGHPDVAP